LDHVSGFLASFSLQRIQYARAESDAVAKLKGTFKADKKKRQEKAAAARGD
jgi:hypothetical protein